MEEVHRAENTRNEDHLKRAIVSRPRCPADLLEAAVVHDRLADVDEHAVLAEGVLEPRLRPAPPLHLPGVSKSTCQSRSVPVRKGGTQLDPMPETSEPPHYGKLEDDFDCDWPCCIGPHGAGRGHLREQGLGEAEEGEVRRRRAGDLVGFQVAPGAPWWRPSQSP